MVLRISMHLICNLKEVRICLENPGWLGKDVGNQIIRGLEMVFLQPR